MSELSSPATPKRGLLARLWQIPPGRGLVLIGVLCLVVLGFRSGVFAHRESRLNELAKHDVAIPDVQQDGYDWMWLHHFATGLSPEARDYYIRSQWQFDMIFPFVYGALFALAIAVPWEFFRRKHALGEQPRHVLWLWVVPLLAVSIDLAENVTVISLLKNPQTDCVTPESWREWGDWAGRFTMFKWRFCLASLILVGLGCVCAAVPRRGAKK